MLVSIIGLCACGHALHLLNAMMTRWKMLTQSATLAKALTNLATCTELTLGHFWLSAPYMTIVLTGACTPSSDFVGYTRLVHVHPLRTSPI